MMEPLYVSLGAVRLAYRFSGTTSERYEPVELLMRRIG
jgi:hypothetical protein